MRLKVPNWAVSPILLEAGKAGLKIAKLNGFPELSQDEVEILNKMVVKRVGKLKTKKAMKRFINSINFSKLVYTELGKLYEAR